MSLKELKIEPDNTTSDSDTCDSEEMNRLLPNCPQIAEKQITSNKNYILELSASSETCPNIALGLSNHICEVYTLDAQLAHKTTLSEHNNVITGLKFSPTNSNLLYSSAKDGSIKLWDLRTKPESVNQFQHSTSDKAIKAFNAFDVSPNERLLTAGTDLFEGDAFILFWDIRNPAFLGGYWETHNDDVTQVKFQHMNRLASGSTDGLINIYDLSQNDEANALIDTFNTESSVEKLDWLGDELGCVTHTVDLQGWKLEGAEPSFKYSRGAIAKLFKRKRKDFVYVVNIYSFENKKFALCGSHFKECLRTVQIGKCLFAGSNFTGNQQTVRCSWLNENTNLLLTGGEKGILNVWKFGFN